MKTLKLSIQHRGDNSTTFTGRPQGKGVRKNLNLSDEDKNKDPVTITIPAGTTSFNPSFYLGLFFDSILYLKGIDNFKKKYQIQFEDTDTDIVGYLKENIADCERQASNEYNRNSRI